MLAEGTELIQILVKNINLFSILWEQVGENLQINQEHNWATNNAFL